MVNCEGKIMKDKSKLLKVLLPVAVMAVLITAAGIYFHQNFVRILPLYVSLFVMILSAKVNRYAYLLGGLNSILYGIIYIIYGLYGIAAQAFLFSFPMQIITFFRWKKNSAGKNSVKLRKMSGRQRLLCVAAYAAGWAGLYFILKYVGSDYAVLDNTLTLMGVFTTVLTALAYIEYTWLMIPSGIMNILLYLQVISNNPEQTAYLIYSVYSLICVTIQFFNARKMWKSQQNKA